MYPESGLGCLHFNFRSLKLFAKYLVAERDHLWLNGMLFFSDVQWLTSKTSRIYKLPQATHVTFLFAHGHRKPNHSLYCGDAH